MIKLAILAFLAAASAAPYYPDRYDFAMQPYFNDDLFDTHRFWVDMERELRELDERLTDFHRHFPRSDSSVGMVGNSYKLTIGLPGFDEKDIIVKARDGVLMVQAVHKTGESSQKSYLAIYTLPVNLDLSGVWSFENEVLRISFPVKGGKPDATTSAPTPPTTATPTEETTVDPVIFGYSGNGDREEMGSNNENDNLDADVGVQDSKNYAIVTNEIQTSASGVEATTYSVDLKDEVEFVPVHYK